MGNPNPATVVAFCAAFYALLNTLASVLRADNTALALAPPLFVRVAALVTGGGVQAWVLTVTTGTPWWAALPAAALTGYLAWLTSGKRVTPGASAEEAVRQKSHRPRALSDPPPPPPAAA